MKGNEICRNSGSLGGYGSLKVIGNVTTHHLVECVHKTSYSTF